MNNFELIVDSREERLINALRSDYLKKECGHIIFDIKQLDVGDIVFQYNGQVVCLIERKTLEDYAASITDKRSKNQSIRISQLKKDNPEIIIIYLIEGHHLNKDHKFRNGITRDVLYSSIINRVVRDKFIIYHTADIYDTSLFVSKMYNKLPEQLDEIHHVTDERIDYLKTIKLAKKDNITPDNCYLCQLAQIPGVSVDIANIISQQYPSMRSLIIAYEKLETENLKENLLAELPMQIANNKTRRLGNVLSKRIYEFLCHENNVVESNIPLINGATLKNSTISGMRRTTRFWLSAVISQLSN